MRPLARSPRIATIEQHYHAPVPALLRRWHTERGQQHRTIAARLRVPRPTVTRWFRAFHIPTLPCHRITNQNLLNTGPRKSPPAKPKPIRLLRATCDESFFDTWTPESAYVLGYFAADGCMFRNPRGSYYLDFTSTDRELIILAKRLLQAPQHISAFPPKRRAKKIRYHLQIGSKRLFKQLRALGFTERKSLTLRWPAVPSDVLPHFVRGYFDGDGCIGVGTYARGRSRPGQYYHAYRARFTSGSKPFLIRLRLLLQSFAGVAGGSIFLKGSDGGFDLEFSNGDTQRLFHFMYSTATEKLYLRRKYEKFLRGQKLIAGQG
ncbi:hypothetical protein HY635_02520 [Candidatus Uhrbacteria bacterium]|nr:hypothetical protein [Candidatus Uhrbacteria bacterium]